MADKKSSKKKTAKKSTSVTAPTEQKSDKKEIDTGAQEQMVMLEQQTVRYLKRIADQYAWKKVIARGLLTGIFTTTGAFLGIILLVFFASRLVAGLSEIPFLDDFLRQTKLDVLIESELNRLSGQSNDTVGEDGTLQYTEYNNQTYSISFDYPDDLTSIRETDIEDGGHLIRFMGSGLLRELHIYIDSDVKVGGEYEEISIVNPSIDSSIIRVYEEGGTVDSTEVRSPLYTIRFTLDEREFVMIGYGDTVFPLNAREIFATVVRGVR